MTYFEPFLRLVVQGTLYGTEDFTYSLALRPWFNNEPYDEPTEVPAAVIAAVQAFHTAAKVAHEGAVLKTVKLNLIGVDGRYVNPTTVLHDYEPGVPGTVVTAAFPPQAALAVSLMTEFSRGRGARGRFYLPLPGVSIDSTTGMASAGSAADIATAATTFLNALNAALPGWKVGVVSNIGTGVSNAVTNVRVGRVIDTIRSRREKFAEDYQVGAALAT